MKKYSLLMLALSLGMQAPAKSMTEIWKLVPDSLIPYIDANHRLEMTEFIGMGLNGEVDNLMQSKSKMDTLTSDYIRLTLSESSLMELKRLPYEGGDSILCVVKTWKTPQEESIVNFYTQDWKPLSIASTTDANGRFALDNMTMTKPESMSQAEFERLTGQVDFIFTSVHLSAKTQEMVVYRTAPLTPLDDKDKMKTILQPIVLKWNGTTFK